MGIHSDRGKVSNWYGTNRMALSSAVVTDSIGTGTGNSPYGIYYRVLGTRRRLGAGVDAARRPGISSDICQRYGRRRRELDARAQGRQHKSPSPASLAMMVRCQRISGRVTT